MHENQGIYFIWPYDKVGKIFNLQLRLLKYEYFANYKQIFL
jgi:hypothetical protein